MISNALELSRSYRRMNSSSVNSTFNLLSNLNGRGSGSATRHCRSGVLSKPLGKNLKDMRLGAENLDDTDTDNNKENTTTVEQSTLLNNEDLVT